MHRALMYAPIDNMEFNLPPFDVEITCIFVHKVEDFGRMVRRVQGHRSRVRVREACTAAAQWRRIGICFERRMHVGICS